MRFYVQHGLDAYLELVSAKQLSLLPKQTNETTRLNTSCYCRDYFVQFWSFFIITFLVRNEINIDKYKYQQQH